jgi:hypothetical protein
MAQARREYPQLLKMLALAFTTLLMDRFDWFVMGVKKLCCCMTVHLQLQSLAPRPTRLATLRE